MIGYGYSFCPMGKLILGKTIAETLLSTVQQRVANLKKSGITPKMAVVLVGSHKPSQTYVRKKGEAAKAIGIDFVLHELPATIGKKELIDRVLNIQKDPQLSGLIVQLPLPEPLYTADVLNAIRPEYDIDCLTHENLGRLVMKEPFVEPPTARAVMRILEHLHVDLIGKDVVIIGVGALVGKPLAIMMMNARASVTTANSKTKHLKEKCRGADIVVTGVGKKNVLRGSMVKRGAIVIDTGVSFDEGKMSGDVNVAEVQKIAKYVTPTPGGVGPITIAELLNNVVICAEKKI